MAEIDRNREVLEVSRSEKKGLMVLNLACKWGNKIWIRPNCHGSRRRSANTVHLGPASRPFPPLVASSRLQGKFCIELCVLLFF